VRIRNPLDTGLKFGHFQAMLLDNRSAVAAGKTTRSRVTNGKSLWIDGDKRGPAARRFKDIFAAIISDLGGADRLSEGQKQLARRCSLLAVQCEEIEGRAVLGEEIDLDAYGMMTDRLGRAFQRLGLKRIAKNITPAIDDYLAAKARQANSKLADCDLEGVAYE
jgi:hypothetical protein